MVIKDLRVKNGWSQERLAELTNLSTRTIQRIEKDDNGSLESLNSLASAFKLDIKELQEMLNEQTIETTQTPMSKNSEFFKDTRVVIFILVNIFLFIINMSTSPEHIWFIYPLLGWGIPLFYKRYKESIA